VANYNKLILLGNLTRDPETKAAKSGTTLTTFGLAVNDARDKEHPLFVDCVAFGKTAEVIAQHCRKGSSLLVDGRLSLDQWTDKDGQKRSRHKVLVDTFQFIGERRDGERTSDARADVARVFEKPVSEDASPF
jgi:single-strand DNA-binding protein